MKYLMLTIVFSGLLSITIAAAGEISTHSSEKKTGAICFGPDMSKAFPDQDIFIKVNSSQKVLFSGAQGKIAFDDLELNSRHTVRILKGETPFESFKVNFKKLKSNFIVIWKAAGVWKFRPVGGETCDWPVPSCPKGYNCP